MDAARLRALGLEVQETASGLEVQLALGELHLENPVTRQAIARARLAVQGERLVPVDPSALAGLPPLAPAGPAQVAEGLAQGFREALDRLQERTAELQVLGLTPQVDPDTLLLSAELRYANYRVVLGADRAGTFSVLHAERGGVPLKLPGASSFELSLLKDRSALITYVSSLVSHGPEWGRAEFGHAPPGRPLLVEEVAAAFGPGTRIPPQSPVELLVELVAEGTSYRFAAARVQGTTFRGLLAGPSGKVWSGRFDLAAFPGVAAHTARLLKLEPRDVQVLVQSGEAG